ncbi:hypothetical protein V6Z11_D05G417300 [Gossypium hirsutum]
MERSSKHHLPSPISVTQRGTPATVLTGDSGDGASGAAT